MATSALSTLGYSRCSRSYDPDRVQQRCLCGAPLLARYDLAAAAATLTRDSPDRKACPHRWKVPRRWRPWRRRAASERSARASALIINTASGALDQESACPPMERLGADDELHIAPDL